MSGNRGPDTPGDDAAADPSDDFGGIGRGGMALILAVMTLTHPREALRELLGLIRHLGRRVRGLLAAPFRLAFLIVRSRSTDRRPTFEEHLRGAGQDEEPP